MITTRYARANVTTLPAYLVNLPNLYLIYLDTNNLYGWAMSEHWGSYPTMLNPRHLNFSSILVNKCTT